MVMIPGTAPEVLQLRGVTMDTVQAFGPSIPYVHLHRTEPFFHALFQWFIDAGVSVPTLAATLTAGRNKDGKLLSQQERDGYVIRITKSLKDSGFDLSGLP
nr:hypothetical protein [Tanacetum cinerariifolium]